MPCEMNFFRAEDDAIEKSQRLVIAGFEQFRFASHPVKTPRATDINWKE